MNVDQEEYLVDDEGCPEYVQRMSLFDSGRMWYERDRGYDSDDEGYLELDS